jgi:hypothetical protein
MAFSVGGKDVNRGGSGEIETERTKKAYGKNRGCKIVCVNGQ